MSLPPFEKLEQYSTGEASPQSFYVSPEQETFTDWKISVGGKALPVHSQVLCMASKVFCDMMNSGVKPTEAIPLSCLPKATMSQALALLRFIYDRESLTHDNIHHLSLHDNLGSVLRLAHGLDCPYVFKVSRSETKELVTPPGTGFLYDPKMTSDGLVTSDLVKDIRNFAVDTKDEVLLEACYNYLAKRCNKITNNHTSPASAEDSVSLVRDFSDCPDLLRAALYYMQRRNGKYTGKTITRVLDNERYIPPALFSFKYQYGLNSEPLYIEPMADENNKDFGWNEYSYESSVQVKGTSVGHYISSEIPENEIGPKVEFTIRVIHWSDLSKSQRKTYTIQFPCPEGGLGHTFVKESEDITPWLDEDGVLYVQVDDVTVLEAPPAVENPPPEGANNAAANN